MKSVLELEREKADAIARLDFEAAISISKRIFEQREHEAAMKRHKYLQSFAGSQNISQRKLELEKKLIALREEQEMRAIKREYASIAKILAQKQRNEAQALEQKWRDIYTRVKRDAENRFETSLISARLLARCDNYDQAISVRDATRGIDKSRMIDCCNGFKKQYKVMTARHDAEFDRLYSLFKDYAMMLEHQSQEMEIAAEAKCAADESEQNVSVIDAVLRSTTSEDIKRQALEQFSPRKSPTRGSPRKSPFQSPSSPVREFTLENC